MVVVLQGELDVDTIAVLHAAVADGPAAAALVLDLRDLMFLDTTGLRAILELDQQCREPPRRPFALVRGRPALHRVFEVSGLASRLRFIESPDEVL